MWNLEAKLYVELAAAYVRGYDPSLASATDTEAIAAGRERGIALHRLAAVGREP